MLNGIDISNHNKVNSYNPENFDFIIIKATEGRTYKDKLLDAHYNRIHGKADGKPDDKKLYGFYHYARPENNSPENEAANFLNAVRHHAGYALFALDWEDRALNYGSEWPLRWLNCVYHATGVKPLFYVQASKSQRYAALATAGFGLWIADWNKKTPRHKGWPFWALWQTGIKSGLDRNLFNGTAAQFKKYASRENS